VIFACVASATASPDANFTDYLTAVIISLMFFATGAPAFVLAVRDRSLKIAFALAVAFPVALALLFVATLSRLDSLRYLS